VTIKPTKTIEGLERDKFLRDLADEVAVRVVLGAQDAIPVIIQGGGGGDSSNIEQDFADTNISAVKAIYKTNTGVSLANNDIDLAQATVIGFTRTAAASGEKITYQTIGKFSDSTLSFTLNAQLYLDTNGNITEVAPITGFRTLIGTSLGNGAIQINIQEPIIL
jgi:uncharacterized membrane protein YqiK